MSQREILIAALAMIVAWPADAAARPHPAEKNWAQVPTQAEHEAAEAGIRREPHRLLRAVARCAVSDSGELSDCSIVSESPAASGLGEALLSLTHRYRRKPPKEGDLRHVYIVDGVYEADVQADWRRQPTPDEMLAVWPTEAYKNGQSGEAVINCVVTVQGALRDCVAVEESPLNAGFGAAAIALAPQFLMKPATKDGVPVEAVTQIPVVFKTYGAGSTVGSKKVLPANVAWSEAPSYSDVAAAYPQRAREEGKGGRATLSCRMTQEGRLSKCERATSSPGGYGFDSAARALSRKFAYVLRTEEDRKAARDLVVHLPFTFDPSMLGGAAPVVGKPNWAAIPGRQQLQTAFAQLGLVATARVVMVCVVQPGGALSDCAVASEDPAGVGLGQAALALASSFRVTTWTAEGLPVVGARVRIPLRYEPAAPTDDGAPAPAAQ